MCRAPQHDESGAILVLALLVLVISALVVVPLANLVRTDLQNTVNYASSRSLEAAASNATQLAIQNVRYNPLLTTSQTLLASPPSSCWGTGSSSQLSGIAVWCRTVWSATSATTRTVTFSACSSSLSAASCAATPSLQAVVIFDDYPAGISAPTSGQCVVYCGSSMSISSWVWQPTIPTVTGIITGIGTTSGSITGGTSLTISGTAFTTGSTVNFVQESGGVPVSSNVPPPSVSGTYNAANGTITAVTPSTIVAGAYFVTVTTPAGTSAYGPTANPTTDIFTYTAGAPTLTSLSVANGITPPKNTGSTSGGSTITITGTNFVAGSSVTFTEESDSTVNPAATSVVVVSDTTITAVSPSVTNAAAFWVTVTTPFGTSSTGPAAVFTYQALVPTVGIISPTTGPIAGGTTVQLSGTGFISGATVSFAKESGGNVVSPTVSGAGTNVTIKSTNVITVVSPQLATGYYFVTVSTSAGTSNNFPIFQAQ